MAFENFRVIAVGWMVSPDGDDYCPSCWEKLTRKMAAVPSFTRDSRPLNDDGIVQVHRVSDGWFAACSGCSQTVSAGEYPNI